MQSSLVAPSTSFAVGDRVRYEHTALTSRTGSIVALEASQGELLAKLMFESGGAQWLSVQRMKPAPTIASQLVGYTCNEINDALHALVFEDLKNAVLARLCREHMLPAAEVRRWVKARRVPVNYLQRLADAFGVTANQVREQIEQMRYELEDATARAQIAMQRERIEAQRVEASGAPKPWEIPIPPEIMASYVAAMQQADRI